MFVSEISVAAVYKLEVVCFIHSFTLRHSQNVNDIALSEAAVPVLRDNA